MNGFNYRLYQKLHSLCGLTLFRDFPVYITRKQSGFSYIGVTKHYNLIYGHHDVDRSDLEGALLVTGEKYVNKARLRWPQLISRDDCWLWLRYQLWFRYQLWSIRWLITFFSSLLSAAIVIMSYLYKWNLVLLFSFILIF